MKNILRIICAVFFAGNFSYIRLANGLGGNSFL